MFPKDKFKKEWAKTTQWKYFRSCRERCIMINNSSTLMKCLNGIKQFFGKPEFAKMNQGIPESRITEITFFRTRKSAIHTSSSPTLPPPGGLINIAIEQILPIIPKPAKAKILLTTPTFCSIFHIAT